MIENTWYMSNCSWDFFPLKYEKMGVYKVQPEFLVFQENFSLSTHGSICTVTTIGFCVYILKCFRSTVYEISSTKKFQSLRFTILNPVIKNIEEIIHALLEFV